MFATPAAKMPINEDASTWLDTDYAHAYAAEIAAHMDDPLASDLSHLLNGDLDRIDLASYAASDSGNEEMVDESKLTKEELRKHKNRQSAARSRQRSRERLEQLEGLVRDLEHKNRSLQQTVQMLAYERMAGQQHMMVMPEPLAANLYPVNMGEPMAMPTEFA
ncbi:hypothetical protein Poli38472_004795 [Pythium oligandrum]|uniref:BZIP domain-containing protein n=1 Tax=Pythium oligandrum TaxID=41045 RepID=A0A8K1CB52_PYTOL|nr:hypothetical protein Poli38472_004795 [Pythium oligandrum]|eukprot:TMW59726.1 hypothetical protein Poli38472_004795 [Pythium oligandrum]